MKKIMMVAALAWVGVVFAGKPIALMGFGFDYDTMYCEWATKGFVYYITTKAHFNPDRLDFDSFADDYCRAGFGPAAREVRAYFDAVERATDAAAAGDAVVLKRLARLQFGNDVGRFSAWSRLEKPSKPTAEERAAFIEKVKAYLAEDPAAFKAVRFGIK